MPTNANRQSTARHEDPFHVGHRIRRAREAVGQDRQTFAETIGVHRDTLAKYEDTGKVKRSALISIQWATPARLEWLETGELPWRKDERDDESANRPPKD